MTEQFEYGERVLVQAAKGQVEAIYRGLNPKIPGDFWIEFTGYGWWSFHPSNVRKLNAKT